MTTLQIAMLGPLQVTIGGAPTAFRTDAERALLAYLAAHQGQAQRRDTLAALLSPERADQEALTYLRNRLTRLRSALDDEVAHPPWFAIDRKQITLRATDNIAIDLVRFEHLLATVESHGHRRLAGCPACLAQLHAAVQLVRGELLAGLNFPSDTWEAWLTAQREHVQQRALDAMTQLRNAWSAQGEWEGVLDVAQRQLRLEPWLEAAHRAAMTAHHRRGDRNAALAQYEQCVQLLHDELGVEPEEATQTLRQQLFERGQGAVAKVGPPDNLPRQTTRFVGRELEEGHLLRRLADAACRLVTVVGAGGIGKTRLAIEAGRQVKMSFPDGVWFVPLDAVKADGEQIKIAVGEAMGLGQDDRQLTGEQVLALLRDKQLLLILDNCESALDAISFVSTWLRRAPGLVILATSREPLLLEAESVVLLDGLPIGASTYGHEEMGAAEQLFALLGRMARDDFVVSAENLSQVRQICQLVDGSPLGIALAAAWVRRRSPAQIIDAIGQSLDFLSTGLRDVDPRHRSMRAVFETSWQLLSEDAQSVLAALSVFPTTFTAEAAAQVTGASLADLDLLCEKSLLQQDHAAERYAMHSLVHQFATEKLSTRAQTVDRAFVDYFHQFARTAPGTSQSHPLEPTTHRPVPVTVQDSDAHLEPEWRNFLAAVTKAHALAMWSTVLELVERLDDAWFRQIRYNDMRAALPSALAAAGALQEPRAAARIRLRLGEIAMELNDYAAAEASLTDAIQHFTSLDDSLGIAQAQHFLGRVKLEQAQDDEAYALSTASQRIFEENGDWLGVARNLNLLALWQIKNYRDFEAAHTYLTRAASLQRTLPPSSIQVETLRHLGRVKSMLVEYSEAEQCLVEASQLSGKLKNVGDYAAVLYERLLLCKKQHQYTEALSFGYECLENFKKLGSLRWEALIKTQLGLLHQAQQDRAKAATLLEEGLQIFHLLGDVYEQAYSYYYLSALYAELDQPQQSRQARDQARRLNLELNDPQLTERLK